MPGGATRSRYEHWLIGPSTSVLRNDFVEGYCRGDSINLSTSLPFAGPLMLPTKGECLKLSLFFKDEDGRKNTQSLSNGTITSMVQQVITHYWRIAGYETEDMKLSDGHKHDLIGKIVKSYRSLLKSRSKNSDKAKAAREAFLADMATCLNFGVSDLRDRLLSDRIRSNLGVQVEDVRFLDDQFGARKRWSMSNTEDKEFAARKAASQKRKLPPVSKPPEPIQTSSSHDDDDDSDDIVSDDENKENKDKDFVVPIKCRKKGSKTPESLVLWTEQRHQAALP